MGALTDSLQTEGKAPATDDDGPESPTSASVDPFLQNYQTEEWSLDFETVENFSGMIVLAAKLL